MDHLFACDDGALYDTRVQGWYKQTPLRRVFKRTYGEIRTTAEFKATLRAGAYAWPGGYQQYLVCSDGDALCFDCGRKELRNILDSIARQDRSGWRVMATDINWEDSQLYCAHCSELIPSAYGD